jgi:hypothetical protein
MEPNPAHAAARTPWECRYALSLLSAFFTNDGWNRPTKHVAEGLTLPKLLRNLMDYIISSCKHECLTFEMKVKTFAQRSCNSGSTWSRNYKMHLMTSDRNNTTRQQLLIHLSLAIAKKIPYVQAYNDG